MGTRRVQVPFEEVRLDPYRVLMVPFRFNVFLLQRGMGRSANFSPDSGVNTAAFLNLEPPTPGGFTFQVGRMPRDAADPADIWSHAISDLSVIAAVPPNIPSTQPMVEGLQTTRRLGNYAG